MNIDKNHTQISIFATRLLFINRNWQKTQQKRIIVRCIDYGRKVYQQNSSILYLRIFIYFFKLQESQSGLMEDNEQSLELYESYPLIYFHPYRKITNSLHYKAAPYKRLSATLQKFVEIFIEYLLLLLQSASKSEDLSIALYPGLLYGQNVHFYSLVSKTEKGLAKVQQNQIPTEIRQFISTLAGVNIIDAQEQQKEDQFRKIVECLNNYLENNEQGKQSSISNNRKYQLSFILNFLIFISNQKTLVKYSSLFQIKNCFMSIRIITSSIFIGKNPKCPSGNNANNELSGAIDVWRSRVEQFNAFLTDCENASIICRLQRVDQVIDLQGNDSTETQNQIELVVLRFEINLFNVQGDKKTSFQSIQERQIVKDESSRTIEVALQFQSDEANYVSITTKTLWRIDKKHFPLIQTLWMRIQLQWMKIASTYDTSLDIMGIQNFKIFLSQQNFLQIRQRIKFQSTTIMQQKIICSTDKQLCLQLMLFPYFEAIHRKINELPYVNKDLFIVTEQRFLYIALLLKAWTSFLYEKLSCFVEARKE